MYTHSPSTVTTQNMLATTTVYYFFIDLIHIVLSIPVKEKLEKKYQLCEQSYLKRNTAVSISPQANDFGSFQ